MAKRRRTFRKKSNYRKKRGGVRRRTSTKSVKRIVRKEIARTTENKVRVFADLEKVLRVSADAANFDLVNVFPLGLQAGAFELQQGTAQGQRVGNRIRVKRATIKGTLVALPYNATSNITPAPCQVKMVLFYDRQNPSTIPAPAVDGDIFDFNTTITGFYGDLVDMWATFNTERYRILKTKVFKVGYANSNLNAAGTTGSLNYSNNDFKYNCNFNVDFTKYLVKSQRFIDNNINATNRQLYMMWIPVAATGGIFNSAVRPIGLQYQATLTYEDA